MLQDILPNKKNSSFLIGNSYAIRYFPNCALPQKFIKLLNEQSLGDHMKQVNTRHAIYFFKIFGSIVHYYRHFIACQRRYKLSCNIAYCGYDVSCQEASSEEFLDGWIVRLINFTRQDNQTEKTCARGESPKREVGSAVACCHIAMQLIMHVK